MENFPRVYVLHSSQQLIDEVAVVFRRHVIVRLNHLMKIGFQELEDDEDVPEIRIIRWQEDVVNLDNVLMLLLV